MIPPPPRRCGDRSVNPLEEALVYIFEINDHDSMQGCGSRGVEPSRVRCSRCVARNVLLAAGWTLSPREARIEVFHGLLEAADAHGLCDA